LVACPADQRFDILSIQELDRENADPACSGGGPTMIVAALR
jgi:hypothetical protein